MALAATAGLVWLGGAGCASAPARPGENAGMTEFFIDPHGQDVWEGTSARPFATLERARDALRACRQAGRLVGPATVWIRGGVYARTNTFALAAEDAGTPEAPVAYRAWREETPIFTGGRTVGGWTRVTDEAILRRLDPQAAGKIWQADLRAQGITDFGKLTPRGFGRPITPAPLELFFRREPMIIARWPDADYARIRGVPAAAKVKDEHGGTLGKLPDGFLYEGDRPLRWFSLNNL